MTTMDTVLLGLAIVEGAVIVMYWRWFGDLADRLEIVERICREMLP